MQKFHFLFMHNLLLGIPPNKIPVRMDDRHPFHVCVVAARVSREIKPREWKWVFWFYYIIKPVLCIGLSSILVRNNFSNYLTCGQYKENVQYSHMLKSEIAKPPDG